MKGGGWWYPATVEKVLADGTLDIVYDDGEREAGVKPHLVRIAKGREAKSFEWGVGDDRRWDLSAGGSSGGAAAAVASGATYGALASDTGGSVRQPAAWCGVVGLKPSYGRVSRHGLIAYASSLDCPGIITRTVGDAALMLDVLATTSPDSMDATSVTTPPPPGGYLPVGYRPPGHDGGGQGGQGGQGSQWLKGLRVGIPREYHVEELHGSTVAAWEEAAAAMADAGAEVSTVSVPMVRHALPAYYVIASGEASSNLAKFDGLRYGMRAETGGGGSEADGARLHESIIATRTQG